MQQDFDLEEEFGAVQVGDLEGTIEINARMGGAPAIHEFGLKVSLLSIDGCIDIMYLCVVSQCFPPVHVWCRINSWALPISVLPSHQKLEVNGPLNQQRGRLLRNQKPTLLYDSDHKVLVFARDT